MWKMSKELSMETRQLLASLTLPVSEEELDNIAVGWGGGNLMPFKYKMLDGFPRIYKELLISIINAQVCLGMFPNSLSQALKSNIGKRDGGTRGLVVAEDIAKFPEAVFASRLVGVISALVNPGELIPIINSAYVAGHCSIEAIGTIDLAAAIEEPSDNLLL